LLILIVINLIFFFLFITSISIWFFNSCFKAYFNFWSSWFAILATNYNSNQLCISYLQGNYAISYFFHFVHLFSWTNKSFVV
jgi:hypothetical protein